MTFSWGDKHVQLCWNSQINLVQRSSHSYLPLLLLTELRQLVCVYDGDVPIKIQNSNSLRMLGKLWKST